MQSFSPFQNSHLTASATRKKRKRSRLLAAITAGHLEKVVKALASCDPNFVDETPPPSSGKHHAKDDHLVSTSGETPLSLAASITSTPPAVASSILVALVNGGALLDFRTRDGRTALHAAVQRSNLPALKTLLDLGGSPNLVDGAGLTPLYYTVLHRTSPKLAQLLLHEHAKSGVTDQHGWAEVHQVNSWGVGFRKDFV